jgi:MGT family glycosyltransferase
VEAGLGAADEIALPFLNAVRVRRGLQPLAHPWDAFFRAPLILATTSEPFEYPRTDWPPSLRFVGPIPWEESAACGPMQNFRDERPLVLVVGSTVLEEGDARGWIDVAFSALADEPYAVVGTLPTGELPSRLPPNVRVERYVPHGAILPLASCVVCHGGAGITQKALALGVPVVAIPFSHDRFEVARRVEVAGAGVRLPGRRLTPGRLRAAVHKAMRCKPGAERVAGAFARAGGPRAAADEIEELLKQALGGRGPVQLRRAGQEGELPEPGHARP